MTIHYLHNYFREPLDKTKPWIPCGDDLGDWDTDSEAVTCPACRAILDNVEQSLDADTWETLWDGGEFEADVAVIDNGGATLDRYTVCVSFYSPSPTTEGDFPVYWTLTMSRAPFHPQGVCLTSDAWPQSLASNELRIPFSTLPADCQRAVVQSIATGCEDEGGAVYYDSQAKAWGRESGKFDSQLTLNNIL